MPLIVRRKVRDTWRAAVARRAGPDDPGPLARFDAMVAAGAGEAEAAYRSLAAAGLLWRADEPGATPGDEAAPREGADA